MEHKTLYLCDPEKNKTCRKSCCVHNPLAIDCICKATVHLEFAKLDESGKPILAKLLPELN